MLSSIQLGDGVVVVVVVVVVDVVGSIAGQQNVTSKLEQAPVVSSLSEHATPISAGIIISVFSDLFLFLRFPFLIILFNFRLTAFSPSRAAEQHSARACIVSVLKVILQQKKS